MGSDWRQVLCPGLLPPIQLPTGTEQGLPGACTEKKETFQNRQNLPRSALVFLPPERLGGKWPGHATLSLHPSASFPRGEHCPMAHSINHGFPRYCDSSEQVKQAMEQAEWFFPFNGYHSKQLVGRQLNWAKKRTETAQRVACTCKNCWVCSWERKLWDWLR